MPSRKLAVLRQFAAVCLAILLGAGTFVLAQGRSAMCVVSGRVLSGTTPLPGVSLMAARDGAVATATATDGAGTYRLRLQPGDYRITAELPAFATFEQQLSIGDSGPSDTACARTLDVQLTLRSRAQAAATPPALSTSPATPAPGGTGGNRAGGAGRGGANAQNAGGPNRFS